MTAVKQKITANQPDWRHVAGRSYCGVFALDAHFVWYQAQNVQGRQPAQQRNPAPRLHLQAPTTVLPLVPRHIGE
jgi:hypothetical protein